MIDLASGERIDHRAKMWLSTGNAPHGVFDPAGFPDAQYIGEELEIAVLSPRIFALMTATF